MNKTNPLSPLDHANPRQMTIRRPGTLAATPSPDGISTAPFWVEMLLESSIEGENTAMRATLDPGVTTRWHSHPRGQLLYVLSGVGQVQRHGDEIKEVRAGDAIWFAPDEIHWHGAHPDSPFSYISIQAVANGAAVSWFEDVTPQETQQ